ncbi:MAG: hypothetical protein HY000_26435 [Planctomycetes bacterium]|nr:hypothetical protein [Planctomycetota bacterium]
MRSLFWSKANCTALGLTCALSASGVLLAFAGAADETYSPVAPAAAIDASLRSNLRLVQDWLNDRDLASAAEAAEGLSVLARAYQYQSASTDWRDRTGRLCEQCSKLVDLAKRKDAAGCAAAVQQCSTLIDELRQNLPVEEKAVAKVFKPPGSTKALMKLMDGTYADAKSSKRADELAQLAYTLAEVANIAQHLRREAAWHQAAVETREAALQVAKQVDGNNLDAARAGLKNVRQRCEACHQTFKR